MFQKIISSKWIKASIGLLLFTVILEISLRLFWGFGTSILYTSLDKIPSIATPNQSITKFGNHILYNEYSMRSLPLKDTGELRFLVIGNSVINGGNLTDHDSLATSRLERFLQEKYSPKIRVLNLSGGGWGPDVAMEYLKYYGDFGAKGIILVVNHANCFDNLPYISPAGMFEHLPTRQPRFALTEVYHHYIKSKIRFWLIAECQKEAEPSHIQPFNQGFIFFKSYCETHNIPLMIYVHPLLSEVESKQKNLFTLELLKGLDSLNLPYLNGSEYDNSSIYYRDEYHLTEQGQTILAKRLQPVLEKWSINNEKLLLRK